MAIVKQTRPRSKRQQGGIPPEEDDALLQTDDLRRRRLTFICAVIGNLANRLYRASWAYLATPTQLLLIYALYAIPLRFLRSGYPGIAVQKESGAMSQEFLLIVFAMFLVAMIVLALFSPRGVAVIEVICKFLFGKPPTRRGS